MKDLCPSLGSGSGLLGNYRLFPSVTFSQFFCDLLYNKRHLKRPCKQTIPNAIGSSVAGMRYTFSIVFFLPTSSIMSLFLSFHVKVSDRVERRLQEIEREMRTERELVERRQDQLGLISLQLQEVCKTHLLRV